MDLPSPYALTMAKADTLADADRAALRQRLVEGAERMLTQGGADQLSLRQLARDAGTSTMGIYTLFGGKDGLMQALYAEGFARLYRYALSAESKQDPVGWLWQALFAYRRFALEHSALYRLCFGGEQRFVPVERDARFGSLTVPDAGAYQSYKSLMDAFAEGQRCGVIVSGQSADALAHLAWAIIHGLVSLEIAGYVDPGQARERFQESVAMFARAIVVDPADIERLLARG
jgi:AcrR family transcriptional regulator